MVAEKKYIKYRRSIYVIKENKDSERGLFVYSIFYLSILFASICFDKLISNFMIGKIWNLIKMMNILKHFTKIENRRILLF